MPTRPHLWTEVTTSEFDHERAALHFVRQRFPSREPFRAWSNFMFIADDGTRNEVDLFVVSPTGVYLVEIKSHPGRIDGDAGTWVWTRPEGAKRTFDNPLLLAERKAKKLKSLLMNQAAFRSPRMRSEGFYLKAIVFLSQPDLDVGLNEAGRTDVYGPDPDPQEPDQDNDLPGLIRQFTRIDPRYGRKVDRPLSEAIAEAMDQAGIRESTTHRKVGEYELDEVLAEGDGWQDFAATHPKASHLHRRIRIYLTGRAFTEEERETRRRAAEREFKFLGDLEHPGIDRPTNLLQNPRGPALVFDRDPDAERLDHWLADHADEIHLTDRIEMVRQLAETLRFAHRKGLYHRTLSPEHIMVRRDEDGSIALKVRDWQFGARKLSSTTTTPTGTRHVADHVAGGGQLYLAPETLRIPDPQPVPADIWSLGTVSFLILSGEPPARDLDGLHAQLKEHGHLSLASVMDAPPESLDDVIRAATKVDATGRFVSIDEFLEFLDLAFEELEAEEHEDPLDAAKGDQIGDAWTVVHRVGTGSTSVVLLAETEGRREILKVARDEEYEKRIQDEYEVLTGLRDRTIIEPFGLEEIGGRTVLRLEAALWTLARELRENGALSLDLLERFGKDLLDGLVFLDSEGVAHRDIKPDNLGVVPRGKDDERHLVLFDFSLSRTDPTEIGVGTVGYLDPFLEEREPKRWDEQAERYAAAVTLYEMATGTRPEWGDGSTDPLLTELELPSIDGDLFDPAVRDELVEFFGRALHRDPARRFDTASQMRRAWEQAFERSYEPEAEQGEGLAVADLDLSEVVETTAITELPLTAKVRNALQRLDVVTVGALAQIPPAELVRLGGIGAVTRKEINHLAQRVRDRLPGEGVGTETETASIDRLADQLVPKPPADEDHRTAVAAFLGLDSSPSDPWPTRADAVATTGLDRATVSEAMASARTRWRKRPDLTRVRTELVELLSKRNGVVGADELADLLIASRGSLAEEPLRSCRARAVVRAAVEAEGTLQHPRLVARRLGDALLVALSGSVGEGDEARRWDPESLLETAALLGEAAEEIAGRRPLLSQDAVVRRLRAVELPEGVEPFTDVRLVRLAAAASSRVSVSTRLELYPSGMPAEEAIQEARPALLDRAGVTAESVTQRVRARFPDASSLPARPALDALMESIGLRWDSADDQYVLPSRGGVWSTVISSSRRPTSFASPDERDAALQDLEDRLGTLAQSGGFLALTVRRGHVDLATRQVAALAGGSHVDLDGVLISQMRSIIESTPNADWDKVLEADTQEGERAWVLLQQVVDRAMPKVEEELQGIDGVAVVTGLGLIARYDHFGLLERMRDTLTRTRPDDDAALTGMVLVVPGDDPKARPVVDGHPVPVITANQWAHIPTAWLDLEYEGAAA